MPRYVVLLRGINVGRAKRVAMADLRELLCGLGYTGVRTHLQSGNAVVTGDEADPAEHAARIRTTIADRLSLDVRCLVRTADELRAVIDGHPLAAVAGDGSKMMALFLSAAPDPTLLAAHDPIELDPDNARFGDRVIYQWCPDGVLAAPPISTFVERNLRQDVTGRDWNTVTKLATFLDEG
ncbi:MAG: DUF1697 domain-containing protein [Pseudonocardia sp.]